MNHERCTSGLRIVASAIIRSLIVIGIMCGYASMIGLVVTDLKVHVVEARQDCADIGHCWELARHGFGDTPITNIDVIVHQDYWVFRCTRCGREITGYECDMTDAFWRIVERESGLRRPEKKPAEEPNDAWLFQLVPQETEQKYHIWRNLYVWTSPRRNTFGFEWMF